MKFTKETADKVAKKYTEKLTKVIDNTDALKTKNDMLGAINQCIGILQDYSKEVDALEDVKPKVLQDYTWKKIAEISKSGTSEKYFSIGDEKEIELYTGERVTAVILGFCHDNLADGTGKTGITLGLKTNLDGEFEMNSTNTNKGGWKESKMRNEYMQRIFKLLPLELKKNIVEIKKLTSVGGGSDDIEETIDKLFLFSEVECTGDSEYSAKGEGEQYQYFKENRVSTGRLFWLRSPFSGGATYFCCINSYGYINYYFASYTPFARLGFCL